MKLPEAKIKKVKKKVFDEDTSPNSSLEMNLESDGGRDDWGHVSEDERDIDINTQKIGCHVIVKYLDSFYPGRVIDKNISKYLTSVMVSSSINNWRWPVNKDEIWYDKAEIIQIIPEPIALNERGIYKVPQLEK